MSTRTLAAVAAVAALALAVPASADYYKSKADERAGILTPGNPPQPPGGGPNVGGETCPGTTVAAPLPFNDSDDTRGNISDVGTLPAGCNTYTQVSGPDLVYAFTVVAGNSVAISVTPTLATYDPAVYVLGTCGTTASCVIGRDTGLANAAESIPAQAYATGTHAIYVDSFYAETAACGGQGGILCGAGTYNLSVTGNLPAELIKIGIE